MGERELKRKRRRTIDVCQENPIWADCPLNDMSESKTTQPMDDPWYQQIDFTHTATFYSV